MSLLDDLRRRVASEGAFRDVAVTYALIARSGFEGRRAPTPDELLIDMRDPAFETRSP